MTEILAIPRIKYITSRGQIPLDYRKSVSHLVDQDEWWNIRADNAIASIICVDTSLKPIGFAMLEGKHDGPAGFWRRVAGSHTAEIGSVSVCPDHRRMGIANIMISVLHDLAKHKNLRPVIACYEESSASKKMIETSGLFHFIGTFNEIGPTFHAYSA